ncbi:hypothetical protein [Acinetobacter ursingii]
MNNYVDPEFFKAFDHYKAMLDQYGEHHPSSNNQENARAREGWAEMWF